MALLVSVTAMAKSMPLLAQIKEGSVNKQNQHRKQLSSSPVLALDTWHQDGKSLPPSTKSNQRPTEEVWFS